MGNYTQVLDNEIDEAGIILAKAIAQKEVSRNPAPTEVGAGFLFSELLERQCDYALTFFWILITRLVNAVNWDFRPEISEAT
jgi:hypothetical protein